MFKIGLTQKKLIAIQNKLMSAKTLIPRPACGQKGWQKGKPEFVRRTDIDQRANFELQRIVLDIMSQCTKFQDNVTCIISEKLK